ncbi:hypothetical protein [Faecalibacter rhinopitheci]|uniref:Uncharacterized protein n=1 Tax=Faecalibacter rhinopitheci TaxID=2779678 RepID=A0A8J7FP18_9FLAO|nr:hypothetical protein [Faecalibacter rhinopitheci]MBF0598042.1 hypothetical protein [Faecalibacter rhinopitheci]
MKLLKVLMVLLPVVAFSQEKKGDNPKIKSEATQDLKSLSNQKKVSKTDKKESAKVDTPLMRKNVAKPAAKPQK